MVCKALSFFPFTFISNPAFLEPYLPLFGPCPSVILLLLPLLLLLLLSDGVDRDISENKKKKQFGYKTLQIP